VAKKPRSKKKKPALVGIDPWAFSLAKKLAAEYNLLASELYAFLTAAKLIEASTDEIEGVAVRVSQTAISLGKGFAETRNWLLDQEQ